MEFYKYLGIEFNKRVTFSELKVRLADKARRNRAVRSNVPNKWRLSVNAQINLWENIVRSGLEYGAAMWAVGWRKAKQF